MIFVLTPGIAVLAQEPMSKAKQTKMGQLALSDAVTAALQNNPSIKTARAKWESAKQRIPQAAAGTKRDRLPTLGERHPVLRRSSSSARPV